VQERFQISPYTIKAMVLRPGKSQIAIIESDGLSLNRVAAWDYETKKNIFTLRFSDSISYINYSASGGFLIAVRSGRSGIVFINAETGELLESPADFSGSAALAATGRTERIMICYFSSGTLSYWNLETGAEIERFDVAPSIQNPVLFGNSRFLGGFDSQGLLILDAVTGQLLARNNTIGQGFVFPDNTEPSRFYCVASAGAAHTVYRMEITLSGRLNTVSQRALPQSIVPNSAVSAESNVFLGTVEGLLCLLSGNGVRTLNTGNADFIIDAAASQAALGFISEKGALGFLPLDYALLENGNTIVLENVSTPAGTAYTGIVSDQSLVTARNPRETGRFLLWQSGASRSIPLVKALFGRPVDSDTSQFFLDSLPNRFPFRSAAMFGNNALLLDSSGSALIVDTESRRPTFSYTAAGSVDAEFVNQNTIIFGRTAAAGAAPFITVNTSTGETVPLAYPAMVGIRLYRTSGGLIYAASINQAGGNIQTSIIRLDTSNPAFSEKLVEYNGEDPVFTMAVSGRILAATLGSAEAAIYRDGTARQVFMERSMGLPVKIISAGSRFITLDGEGGVTWHDNQTGKLLAVFRLYPDSWVLEKVNPLFPARGREIIRGNTAKK
jgi:hypothetical protein